MKVKMYIPVQVVASCDLYHELGFNDSIGTRDISYPYVKMYSFLEPVKASTA